MIGVFLALILKMKKSKYEYELYCQKNFDGKLLSMKFDACTFRGSYNDSTTNHQIYIRMLFLE